MTIITVMMITTHLPPRGIHCPIPPRTRSIMSDLVTFFPRAAYWALSFSDTGTKESMTGVKSKAIIRVGMAQRAQTIETFCKIGIAAIATRPIPRLSVTIPVMPAVNMATTTLQAAFLPSPVTMNSSVYLTSFCMACRTVIRASRKGTTRINGSSS